MTTEVVGRLAPTPSGHLHLGNVVAFAAAWLSVRQAGGRLLYRVEDVDVGRARAEIAEAQRVDLRWLGLDWDEETPAQSTRDYAPWLARVPDTYFCACSRRQIRDAGGHRRDCHTLGLTEGAVRFHLPPGSVTFDDRRFGTQIVDTSGQDDPVLRRRDGVYAYNLAVTADDIHDGITEVVRGADLLEQSAVQIRLWQALQCPPPTWLHAPLIVDADGRKLSKSEGDVGVAVLRDAGASPQEVWRRVLPWLGLAGFDHLHEAVDAWDPTAGPRGPIAL